MTPTYVTEVLGNIEAISAALDNNALITKTREAVLTGIKGFQITPAEKSKLYANFEMQFSVQVVSKLIDVVVNSGLVEKQIATEAAKVALLTQQLETEVQNTLKVTNEVALLASNKLLVDEQIKTEKKRTYDVMAGILVKNAQVHATTQSAKFEEARRYILIHSTESNDQIQKADREVALIQAIATDETLTISTTHLQRAVDGLDGILAAPVAYFTEIDDIALAVNPETGSVS
jgi:hypothetical protein